MSNKLTQIGFFSVMALCTAIAVAAPPVKTVGGLLVDSNGMTLYTFDKDTADSGKSVCNGPCAALWPPVVASSTATSEGDMTIVMRDDGNKQWAYKGKPVYRFKKDTKAGDVTGDNVKNVWHVIKP